MRQIHHSLCLSPRGAYRPRFCRARRPMKATPTPAAHVFEEFDPVDRRSEYAFLTRKAYIRDVTDAFEELELEPRTIATCGEWVVVDVKVSGHASTVALETD